MKTHQTIQRRVYLRRKGHERLDAVLRDCAGLYNAGLEHWKGAYEATRYNEKPDRVNYAGLSAQLTGVRSDDPGGWGALHVQVGRGVLRRLDRALQAFFRRVKAGEKPGYPRFKSGARWRSIEVEDTSPNMVAVVAERGKAYVRVKGLPTMEMRLRRIQLPPSEDLKSIRITRYPTGVYAAITYEVEAYPLPESGESVGLDMGVNKRITLSDGGRESVLVPRRSPAAAKKRERLQRKQSRQREVARRGGQERRRAGKPLDVRAEWRRAPGRSRFRHHWLTYSKTYGKTARRMAKLSYREAVRNRNAAHRLTTAIVERYGVIALEDLAIQNMTRSASGTLEEPGKGVAQKRSLNRSIIEQTWGLMRQQLTYKAAWAGRELVEVPPHYTSQKCLRCGAVDAGSRKGERYACRTCGWTFDADANAAENIRRQGLEALGRACSPLENGSRRGGRRKNKGDKSGRQPPLDPFATP